MYKLTEKRKSHPFSRPCKKCGEMFKRTGKYEKICIKCRKKSNSNRWRHYYG